MQAAEVGRFIIERVSAYVADCCRTAAFGISDDRQLLADQTLPQMARIDPYV